jgi:hypothetical protein
MAVLTTGARTHDGADTIVMLTLVLAFGNQAFAERADKHAQGQSAWQLFLRTLSWPRWSLTSGSSTTRDLIAMDLRPVLLSYSSSRPTVTKKLPLTDVPEVTP